MRGLTRHTHGFFSNSAICSLVNIVLIVSFVSELILTKENNGTVPFVSTLWGTDHCAPGGIRTPDRSVKSRLLYQLSYERL